MMPPVDPRPLATPRSPYAETAEAREERISARVGGHEHTPGREQVVDLRRDFDVRLEGDAIAHRVPLGGIEVVQ